MKITSDNVKVGLMLGGVLLAAYAVYRATRVASDAADSVRATVSDVGDWFSEKAGAIGGAVKGAVNSVSRALEPSVDESQPYPEAGPIRAAELQSRVTPSGVSGATFEQYSSGEVLDLYGSPSGAFGADSRVMHGAIVNGPDSFSSISGRTL